MSPGHLNNDIIHSREARLVFFESLHLVVELDLQSLDSSDLSQGLHSFYASFVVIAVKIQRDVLELVAVFVFDLDLYCLPLGEVLIDDSSPFCSV